MKNTFIKIFKGIFISAVTLVFGFAATMLTFKLFGELTQNEMRILLAADALAVFVSGCVILGLCDSKARKAKKQKEFEARHAKRVEKAFRELDGIDMAKIVKASRSNAA